MNKNKQKSILFLGLVIGLIAVGVTAPTYATEPHTAVSYQVSQDTIGDAAVIEYSDLSEADQRVFREQIVSGEKRTALESVDAGDYVRLDGQYYKMGTFSHPDTLENAPFYISLLLASILVPITASSILQGFELTRKQFITIVACMTVLLMSVTVLGVETPTVERTTVESTPFSTVSDDAVIAEATNYSDSEYQRLLRGFAGKDTTTDYSDFIDSEVDYIKSDGEYYPVQEKTHTPRNWEGVRVILLFGEAFFSSILSLIYLAGTKWGENGHLMDQSKE